MLFGRCKVLIELYGIKRWRLLYLIIIKMINMWCIEKSYFLKIVSIYEKEYLIIKYYIECLYVFYIIRFILVIFLKILIVDII